MHYFPFSSPWLFPCIVILVFTTTSSNVKRNIKHQTVCSTILSSIFDDFDEQTNGGHNTIDLLSRNSIITSIHHSHTQHAGDNDSVDKTQPPQHNPKLNFTVSTRLDIF